MHAENETALTPLLTGIYACAAGSSAVSVRARRRTLKTFTSDDGDPPPDTTLFTRERPSETVAFEPLILHELFAHTGILHQNIPSL